MPHSLMQRRGRSAVVAVVAAAFGFTVSLYPMPDALRSLSASPPPGGTLQTPSAESTYSATRRVTDASTLRLTALIQLSQGLDDEMLYAGAETLMVLVREFGLSEVMRSYGMMRSIQLGTPDFPELYIGGGGSGQPGQLALTATLFDHLVESLPGAIPELLRRLEAVAAELFRHPGPVITTAPAQPPPAPAPALAPEPAPPPAEPVKPAPSPDPVPWQPPAEVPHPTVPPSVPSAPESPRELEAPTVAIEPAPSASPSGPADGVTTETSGDPSPAPRSESPPDPQDSDSSDSSSDHDNDPGPRDSSPEPN